MLVGLLVLAQDAHVLAGEARDLSPEIDLEVGLQSLSRIVSLDSELVLDRYELLLERLHAAQDRGLFFVD